MTVPDLSVTISYAARGALPYELPPIPSHLQTVTIIPGIILITHEPKERHVHRRHAQLERLKVETEILPKTVEHLCTKTPQLNTQIIDRLDLRNRNRGTHG